MTQNTITITFNKKELTLPEGTTVRDIMNEKGCRKAAVWINGRQLLKAEYDTWQFRDGDTVRFLRVMAGG